MVKKVQRELKHRKRRWQPSDPRVNKSNSHQITPAPGRVGAVTPWACFSPDGKTVLFSRPTNGHNRELLRVPVSGGEAEKLAKLPLPVSATRPSWSSKSNLIAFTGISGDGSSATWVIKSDGTGAHALIAAGLSDQMVYPSWYPDGTRLVAMDGRNLVIKRVDLAGTVAVAITDHAQVLARPS